MMRSFVAGVCLGSAACAFWPRRAVATHGPVASLRRPPRDHPYDYDLVVIGGGSGGIAAANRAAELGAKVALFDYVEPSPHGTRWGLGGTCVNVGCIPKKLMHTAAMIGFINNFMSGHYGWMSEADRKAIAAQGPSSDGSMPAPSLHCDWGVLRENVTNYILSLNFGYNVSLRNKEVDYRNAHATLVDTHTVSGMDLRGRAIRVTGQTILLATGTRPRVPSIPGAKLGVTSDDIFRLEQDPGKTLVIGGSYVALECAGFLHGIGRKATVMMRSVPLRGFDQDMATRVVSYMEALGIPFLSGCVPTALLDLADGQIMVTYTDTDGLSRSDTFDTVLFATGRRPITAGLGLEKAGVKLDPRTGKVVVDVYDQSSVPNIYAVGDVSTLGPELTPVAARAGRLLAERLYGGKTNTMSYSLVPTTVFTPLEYGCVGMSESLAECIYRSDVEVYHSNITPLEWSVPHLDPNACYAKVVVRKSDDKVIGFHLLSPNAGEITQGIAVAMQCGLTKTQLDDTIGIHPTIAEDLVRLRVTKSSGLSPEKQGC